MWWSHMWNISQKDSFPEDKEIDQSKHAKLRYQKKEKYVIIQERK